MMYRTENVDNHRALGLSWHGDSTLNIIAAELDR